MALTKEEKKIVFALVEAQMFDEQLSMRLPQAIDHVITVASRYLARPVSVLEMMFWRENIVLKVDFQPSGSWAPSPTK